VTLLQDVCAGFLCLSGACHFLGDAHFSNLGNRRVLFCLFLLAVVSGYYSLFEIMCLSV
jgi:hypothetical protein